MTFYSNLMYSDCGTCDHLRLGSSSACGTARGATIIRGTWTPLFPIFLAGTPIKGLVIPFRVYYAVRYQAVGPSCSQSFAIGNVGSSRAPDYSDGSKGWYEITYYQSEWNGTAFSPQIYIPQSLPAACTPLVALYWSWTIPDDSTGLPPQGTIFIVTAPNCDGFFDSI